MFCVFCPAGTFVYTGGKAAGGEGGVGKWQPVLRRMSGVKKVDTMEVRCTLHVSERVIWII